MSTPSEDPDAFRDDRGGDRSGDFGAPYGQSPYTHGSGYPGAQPQQPPPGAQSPYPYDMPPPYGAPPQYGMPPHYGVPPQYGAPPQYDVPPHYGVPPQYGMAPQYGMDPQYGAMQPYAPNYLVPGYPVSRKEPAISLVLSFFLPGLGTIINGQAGKGLAIMGGYFFGVLLSIILIGIPIMMGFWIWGLVDAYQGARRHNDRHGFY